MWWWRLIVLLSPPAAGSAAATCFCSHLKTPAQIISKYLLCAYWPWGISMVICFSFFSFNKIQDGRQNSMSLPRAWTAPLICFMFGLKKMYALSWACADYFFGVILIIKTWIFLRFRIVADISVLLILTIIKVFGNIAIGYSSNFMSWVWLLALRNLSGYFFFIF